MAEPPGATRGFHRHPPRPRRVSLFSAWAFVTMPAAMLAAAFHDALEKRRIVAAKRRKEAPSGAPAGGARLPGGDVSHGWLGRPMAVTGGHWWSGMMVRVVT